MGAKSVDKKAGDENFLKNKFLDNSQELNEKSIIESHFSWNENLGPCKLKKRRNNTLLLNADKKDLQRLEDDSLERATD